ncbi:MAG: response regulator [Nibricoccus sp.]
MVEDSDEDFSALERILGKHPAMPPVELQRCVRGEEALARLENGSVGDRKSEPSLIVLDLNLPGVDGRTVLKRVREHAAWKHVPVVIFSTANHPAIISWCYENGANAYHVKEMNYASFKRSVEMLAAYWLESAWLPRRDDLAPPASLDTPARE